MAGWLQPIRCSEARNKADISLNTMTRCKLTQLTVQADKEAVIIVMPRRKLKTVHGKKTKTASMVNWSLQHEHQDIDSIKKTRDQIESDTATKQGYFVRWSREITAANVLAPHEIAKSCLKATGEAQDAYAKNRLWMSNYFAVKNAQQEQRRHSEQRATRKQRKHFNPCNCQIVSA